MATSRLSAGLTVIKFFLIPLNNCSPSTDRVVSSANTVLCPVFYETICNTLSINSVQSDKLN